MRGCPFLQDFFSFQLSTLFDRCFWALLCMSINLPLFTLALSPFGMSAFFVFPLTKVMISMSWLVIFTSFVVVEVSFLYNSTGESETPWSFFVNSAFQCWSTTTVVCSSTLTFLYNFLRFCLFFLPAYFGSASLAAICHFIASWGISSALFCPCPCPN